MPRRPRIDTGGLAYHVLNRGVGRMRLFDDEADYDAFTRVLAEAVDRLPEARLLGYCLMPNHWHLVLHPKSDGLLSEFMRWLTVTHTQRWHAHRRSAGTGPVYQGRFKSFPIEQDEHLLTVLRYVERNAVRAKLAKHAEDWRWGSLWRHVHRATAAAKGDDQPTLSDWPIERPRRWRRMVNDPLSQVELEAMRACVNRGRPFGDADWVSRMVKLLGLESAVRPRGRPRKEADGLANA
jgi:putative transposase